MCALQNCSSLVSLSGLNSLRTIGGTPVNGLRIRNNDLLVDVKGIEKLSTIQQGGVEFDGNNQLCYIETMPWGSIVKPSATEAALRIKAVPMHRNCTTLSCSSSCHCGWCGGSGQCTGQERCRSNWYDPPQWVNESDGHLTGYIVLIIVSVVLVALFLLLVHGCFSEKIVGEMYWTSVLPANQHRSTTPKSPASKSVPLGKVEKVKKPSTPTKPNPKRLPRSVSEVVSANKIAPAKQAAPNDRDSQNTRPRSPESHHSRHSAISLPKLKPGSRSPKLRAKPQFIPPVTDTTQDHRRRSQDGQASRSPSNGELSNADVVAMNEKMLDDDEGSGADGQPLSSSSSFELSRPAAADIAATVLISAQMQRKVSIKAKDVTLDNAPPAMRELATQAFSKEQATLLELEATAHRVTGETEPRAALLQLKKTRQQIHTGLQQRRSTIRGQINAAVNPAQKQSAVSSMIVVRLQLEIFQRMVQDFQMPPVMEGVQSDV
jgi:hypothetical protein